MNQAHSRQLTEVRDSLRELRSEEHTSELQSHLNLVCRLLLEKKKKEKEQLTELDSKNVIQEEHKIVDSILILSDEFPHIACRWHRALGYTTVYRYTDVPDADV